MFSRDLIRQEAINDDLSVCTEQIVDLYQISRQSIKSPFKASFTTEAPVNFFMIVYQSKNCLTTTNINSFWAREILDRETA